MIIEHKIINDIECKKCGHCNEYKSLDNFSKDKSRWDGLYGFCKECQKEKDHNSYMKNPTERYQKVLKYQIKTGLIKKYKPYNPDYYSSEESKKKKRARDINRRVLKSEADKINKITSNMIDELLKKYQYKCAYCGKDCRENYTIDHKLPLYRGGDNSFDNLAIACKHCNSSKRIKTDIEFCGHAV